MPSSLCLPFNMIIFFLFSSQKRISLVNLLFFVRSRNFLVDLPVDTLDEKGTCFTLGTFQNNGIFSKPSSKREKSFQEKKDKGSLEYIPRCPLFLIIQGWEITLDELRDCLYASTIFPSRLTIHWAICPRFFGMMREVQKHKVISMSLCFPNFPYINSQKAGLLVWYCKNTTASVCTKVTLWALFGGLLATGFSKY